MFVFHLGGQTALSRVVAFMHKNKFVLNSTLEKIEHKNATTHMGGRGGHVFQHVGDNKD